MEPSTLRNYKAHVLHHINPAIGDRYIKEVTFQDLREFRDDLVKKGMSRPMAKKVLRSAKSLFEEARRDGIIDANPALDVKIVVNKREQGKVVIPSKEEVKRLLAKSEALAGQKNLQSARAWRRYHVLVTTAAFTGLRASELRGLPWPAINFADRKLEVRQRADENGIIGPCKSHSGYRVIDIPDQLVRLLREWRLACVPSVLKLVFPNGVGNVESQTNIYNRCWTPLQERSGLVDDKGESKYRFHDLGHFRASVLIDQGATPKEVMTEMGHSSIQLTFNTYGHLFPEGNDRRRERANRIADELL